MHRVTRRQALLTFGALALAATACSSEDPAPAAEKSGALRRARARANEYAEAARSALDALKPSKYSDALRSIPSFILEREM